MHKKLIKIEVNITYISGSAYLLSDDIMHTPVCTRLIYDKKFTVSPDKPAREHTQRRTFLGFLQSSAGCCGEPKIHVDMDIMSEMRAAGINAMLKYEKNSNDTYAKLLPIWYFLHAGSRCFPQYKISPQIDQPI